MTKQEIISHINFELYAFVMDGTIEQKKMFEERVESLADKFATVES